jgi:hypothetical protein
MIRDRRRVLPIAWAIAAILTATALGCSGAPATANASPTANNDAGAAKPVLTLKGSAQ